VAALLDAGAGALDALAEVAVVVAAAAAGVPDGAGGLPARRFPLRFLRRLMRPRALGALAAVAAGRGSRGPTCVPCRAPAPSTPSSQSPDVSGPPGNPRADYVLPSVHLRIKDPAVFWKPSTDPLSRLTTGFFPSDHRLVHVDVAVPGAAGR